ncbi:hypothetical protein AN639_04220 [Candidatus Epulonipiscium fishelsonii]|uniref:Uncharacterized protein n=1 Tax=Candidatus Epulonipiscium fishelsonii TaxID=77094 RepID=A0ACC8X9V6_9FIRM|nr:hypothetical protein AN396_09710 [Epulopiscium sp. SCG-B11WGA-EpuloA1]ONI40922.1 hypothetical protein AN639_04220 [Epulopiscium sp. SCG-B05WGA-EpuloA1]
MKLKTLLLGTVLMSMSIPTFATETTPAPPTLDIEAPIATLELPVGESEPVADSQIVSTETKFTLNGAPVLEGIPTFTKNDHIYIPFMDLVDLFNIGWEKDDAGNINFTSEPLPDKFINNVSLAIDPVRVADVAMTGDANMPVVPLPDFLEGGPVADGPWSSDIPDGPTPVIYVPDPENPAPAENNIVFEEEGILMEHVCIVDVKDNNGQISVVIGNPQDPQNPMDQTIFHLTEQTTIKHIMNKRLYTSADLKSGQIVNIEHAQAMTMSIPAQSTAYAITLINDGEEANDASGISTVMEKVKVLDVATKNGKVTSITVGDSTSTEPHTIFSFTENTGIQHIRDRRIYKLEDLKAGQTISVSYSSPILESYPVQIIADHVTIIDALVQ